jgi:hypothetical protein
VRRLSGTLLNNGEAKTPNGDILPFRRFRPGSAAPASQPRLAKPACLALQGHSALTNGERKFVGKRWLPGMDSNHELDKILNAHKLLILQSR